MFRSAKTPRSENRRGAAMVEMALVLPVFLLVLMGMIEFGRAIMVGQLVTNAAREGARMAILDGSTNSSVSASIKSFLTTAAGVGDGDITVTITVDGVANGSLASAESKDLVEVNVGIPFQKVSYLPPTFLQGTQLTGMSAMRHE